MVLELARRKAIEYHILSGRNKVDCVVSLTPRIDRSTSVKALTEMNCRSRSRSWY
uniref:Uncharacterized protein n=1 Tax=Utricularia reniformis TaxID=192314 RepID=A0A1Y0AZI7_9LAMI|nr:hypothetical protein AEK19_MT0323 [Utricularia reniformis]ART30596.1 hypothetical protein AEK19_MT0323 [Utricularia reniformis]